MPLIIDRKVIVEKIENLGTFLHKNVAIKKSSASFCQQEVRQLSSRNVLYVCQREYAVVVNGENKINILGSDDATTCHIVSLRHTGSGVCGLIHCDSHENTGLEELTNKLIALSNTSNGWIELAIVGGFQDPKGYSLKISKAVLNFFINRAEPFHLICCCITDINDVLQDDVHFPVVYGLGLDIKTGSVFPAKFDKDTPDLNIRSAGLMTNNQVVDIYDSTNNVLVIGPYEWEANVLRHARSWLKFSDQEIRKHLSTSPEQEPPHFESCMRAALSVIANNPEPLKSLFLYGNPHRFSMDRSSGQWIQL